MTGGTSEHDTISLNIGAELLVRLRGSSCQAHGSNLKVRAGENGRNPDALVDCGPRVPGAQIPAEPVAIFEVFFRLIALIDESLKLRDYEGVRSIRTYVLLEQERARALVYRRDKQERLSSGGMSLLDGVDALLDLPKIGIFPPVSRDLRRRSP